MQQDASLLTCENSHRFAFRAGVYNLLPGNPSPAVLHDAAYHAAARENWIDLNQLNTERNLRYHRQVADAIVARCDSTSRLLEIGGGVGFDLQLLLERGLNCGSYVFSEISEDLCGYAAMSISNPHVTFATLDVHHIPFPDNYFSVVFMIAALHHFENCDAALRELIRVCAPGGMIVCAIEPNRRFSRLIKTGARILRRFSRAKSHSPADEEAEGFTRAGLVSMAERNNLRLDRLEPVWLFSGAFHLGLEAIYRLLRLKQRLRLPRHFERLMLGLDCRLLRLPAVRSFAWHYSAFFSKPA